MITNHFLKYGLDPLNPLNNFGHEVYFSSLWRYAAGSEMINSLNHYDTKYGKGELVRLL